MKDQLCDKKVDRLEESGPASYTSCHLFSYVVFHESKGALSKWPWNGRDF